MMGKTLLVTGSSGYLAQLLISRILSGQVFEKVIGLDVKPHSAADSDPRFVYHQCDVRDLLGLFQVFGNYKPDTVLHLAWVFNPTRDYHFQREVDVEGSKKVFRVASINKVKKIVYMGSTTAYINPDCPCPVTPVPERYPVCGTPNYLYSAHKAEIDIFFRIFMEQHSEILCTLFRGSIIIGPHTRNVISQMIDWHLPGMGGYGFQVKGADPPMQFLSEEDFVEIMLLALVNDYPGVYNIAGDGLIKYSEIVKMLGKKLLPLPARVIYPLTGFMWEAGFYPFPAGILDLIRYPWVADNSKFKGKFKFTPKSDSRQTFVDFVASRKK